MPPRSSLFQQKAPPPTLEAFPALTPKAGPAVTTAQPQWIKITKAKEKTKPSKVAPAPDLSTPADFSSSFEFPILQVSKKSDKKKNDKAVTKPKDTQPVSTANDNTSNSNNTNSKENKKKKNKINNSLKTEDPAPLETETKAKKSEKENMKFAAAVVKKNLANDLLNKDIKENNNHIVNNVKSVVEKTPEVTNAKPKNFNLEDNFPSLAPSRGITGFKASSQKPVTLSYARPKPSQPAPVSHGLVPPCDGLTFTNSSGQSYNVPVHYYIQPADFNKRNKLLISVFMKVLEGSDMVYEFKTVSRLFRDGTMSADEYFEACKKTLGKDFDAIFPELLVLLPELGKQQELYKVYACKCKSNLITCQTCGQILSSIDLVDHMDAHKMPTDFPALGTPSRKK